ncbi:sensor histidine kinase [Pseudocolwellia sp. HL-MZ19]|uniref:sensor histidine kinase n=1 Tax=unclassified Pseudocolwellia TaxID=2848178 RepID=UPI003CF8858C
MIKKSYQMSIRTYTFVLLTSLVLLIAAVFSYQSASIFLGSFDKMTERLMIDIAKKYPEEGKVEQTVLKYHVTTDWQRVPEPVRRQFKDISTENNTFHSKFIDWVFIVPPKEVYALMIFEHNGQQVFVSQYNENFQEYIIKKHSEYGFFIDPVMTIILFGLSGLIIFVLVLLLIFKRITVPVESLQQWSKTLSIHDLKHTHPDFKFKELNSLAKLILENLESVADSVEREKTFLSYASHELRTPIAVLRSNSALLEKVNPNPSEKERKIRDRIQRASLTMKSMTETLLWLSREGHADMPIEVTNLGDLLKNTQAELTYLLNGKSVEVSIEVDDSEVAIAVMPSLIVLNNLIRNAFQHTQQGIVNIVQKGNEVIITNIESDSELITINDTSADKELGFGLGTKLVEKLTKQFGWKYTTTKLNNGYMVSVFFN